MPTTPSLDYFLANYALLSPVSFMFWSRWCLYHLFICNTMNTALENKQKWYSLPTIVKLTLPVYIRLPPTQMGGTRILLDKKRDLLLDKRGTFRIIHLAYSHRLPWYFSHNRNILKLEQIYRITWFNWLKNRLKGNKRIL